MEIMQEAAASIEPLAFRVNAGKWARDGASGAEDNPIAV
jgi:hypothetical protein